MKQLLLSLATILFLSLTLHAQSYSGGSGTPGDPYLISNKADLKYLNANSSEWGNNFKQTADIHFSSADFATGGDFYNLGYGFRPIGNDTTNFSGSYNGDGHIIDSLYFNRSYFNYIGLFGYFSGTQITNLGVTNVNVKGSEYVGGLVGNNQGGAISNCFATGGLNGVGLVGGLIGNNAGVVSNCYARVDDKTS